MFLLQCVIFPCFILSVCIAACTFVTCLLKINQSINQSINFTKLHITIQYRHDVPTAGCVSCLSSLASTMSSRRFLLNTFSILAAVSSYEQLFSVSTTLSPSSRLSRQSSIFVAASQPLQQGSARRSYSNSRSERSNN